MTTDPKGGTRLTPIPAENNSEDPLDASSARCLASWGDRLERHFGAPQDVEWALDAQGRLSVLQSRPLGLDGPPATPSEDLSPLDKRTVLHRGGRTACSGMVSGRIHYAGRKGSPAPAADSILVIPKAAPEYAPMIGRVRGVIAARGSAASHLASVAREFGVPMIVDTGPIVDGWPEGQWVILHADTATVYDGRLDCLADEPRRALWRPLETPLRRRLRALSSRIVPRASSLEGPPPSAETPVTLHDLLERAHGFVVEALQGFRSHEIPVQVFHWTADNAAGDFAPRTDAKTPPAPHLPRMRSRQDGTEDFLGALWSGLAWPHEGESRPPLLKTGGWALVTDRSLRATAAFGVQQAIVDVFHPADPTSVDVRLRIVGGDGPFYQRCLRAMVLRRLLVDVGFEVQIDGALLDASLSANSPEQARRLLRLIGRLLIFCRRTDAQLNGPWAVETLHCLFQKAQDLATDSTATNLPPALTVLAGQWRQATLDGRSVIVQDGAAGADGFLPDGPQYRNKAQETFFEHLHRDHFLPLAVVNDSRMRDGRIDLGVHLMGGRHACAGGVVFGYRDPGHCFLMGIDALRECLTLYEMRHGRRFKRLRKRYPVHRERWYDIALRIAALSVQIHLDGVPVMAYTGDGPIAGLAGLWARDDTLAVFDGLTLMAGTHRELCV
jgi:pyruvate,water dikinase